MQIHPCTVLLACVWLIGGCTPHIFETFDVQNGQSVSIDAKQRVVLVGTRDGHRIVCAEPSPDALSATAAALNLSGGNGEVQAAVSGAIKEAATSMGVRTPTIQLLRDGLYRACEGYFNNVIDPGEYGIILRNYDRVMVALLAIEAAAGTTAVQNVAVSSGDAPSLSAPSGTTKDPQKATSSTTDPKKAATATTQNNSAGTTPAGSHAQTDASAVASLVPAAATSPSGSADAQTGKAPSGNTDPGKAAATTVNGPKPMDHADQVIETVLDYMLDNNKWMTAVCLSLGDSPASSTKSSASSTPIQQATLDACTRWLTNLGESGGFAKARSFGPATPAAPSAPIPASSSSSRGTSAPQGGSYNRAISQTPLSK